MLQLAAEQADSAAKKKEDAELKKALKASKARHPLEHWATELLFWWGFDIAGWAASAR